MIKAGLKRFWANISGEDCGKLLSVKKKNDSLILLKFALVHSDTVISPHVLYQKIKLRNSKIFKTCSDHEKLM